VGQVVVIAGAAIRRVAGPSLHAARGEPRSDAVRPRPGPRVGVISASEGTRNSKEDWVSPARKPSMCSKYNMEPHAGFAPASDAI